LLFAPDGKTLISFGRDGTKREWDLSTGTQIRTTRLPRTIRLGFTGLSDDGQLAASLQDDTLFVFDVNTGKELARWKSPNAFSIGYGEFSPDGQTLLIGLTVDAFLWQWKTGARWRLHPPLKPNAIIQGRGSSHHGRFSPDGQFALTSGGSQIPLCLWATTTGKLVHRFDDR
jgi:WD40 repeat protein